MKLSKINQSWLKWIYHPNQKKNLVLQMEVRKQSIKVMLTIWENGYPKTLTSANKTTLDDAISEVWTMYSLYNLERAIWKDR